MHAWLIANQFTLV